MFDSQFKDPGHHGGEGAWQQEHEAAGLIISICRKQREVDTDTLLALFILFTLGPQPSE